MTDDVRPGPVDALTDDVIRSLFARAPRLSMGVPRGFARFNRQQLLTSEGIDEQRALLIVDEWVIAAGGRVRSLQPPPVRGLRPGRLVARHQPATVVWEIPEAAP